MAFVVWDAILKRGGRKSTLNSSSSQLNIRHFSSLSFTPGLRKGVITLWMWPIWSFTDLERIRLLFDGTKTISISRWRE